ncbi:hypothetical protein M0R45_026437 [Rubus argutus]|uniref:Pentatricopeptide repeat-containing protein n=1 Tax=Rubus argutus TaxID=59490 RepID=A0AAW1WZ81_RUBAR
MLRGGFKPTHFTYSSVFTVCASAGSMEQGLLDAAEKFVREMPIEPTAAVWGALLGACRMHNNIDLGTYAAEHVLALDPRFRTLYYTR